MTKYKIIANGIDMGTWEADSEDEALDIYASDISGSRTYAEMCKENGRPREEAMAIEVSE